VLGVDQVALDVENRPLLEPHAHLVDADHADVGAGVHRPGRQRIVKRQVCSPGLVHDQWPAAGVADFSDAAKVGTGAVRSGADDERAGSVGMGCPRGLDVLRGGWMREVQPVVVTGFDPSRLEPGEDQAGDHRFVGVS
jgi:hypothetical protein